MVKYLETNGFSANAAAGAIGNAGQESSLKPSNPGGLFANLGTMWQDQVKFDQGHGLDPTTATGQLAYAAWWAKQQSWFARFNAAKSPQDAALWWQDGYEQCSGAGARGTDQVGGGLCNPAHRQLYALAAYHAAGGSGSGSTASFVSSTAAVCGGITSYGGYVNPLAKARGLVPERVDQGVDYNAQAGSPILAIGDGMVVAEASGGTGWTSPENTQACVYYRLTGGKLVGKYVYVCEDIVPTVHKGQRLTAGQTIATFKSSSTGIETGWGSGTPYGALAAPIYHEGLVTAAGVSFSRFMHSLGAPWGVGPHTGGSGMLPSGYP